MEPLAAQILSAFLLGEHQNVKDLPDSDPLKAKGKRLGDTFTQGVDFLRSIFPSYEIRALMAIVWDLVSHKVTPTAIGPEVRSLVIAAYKTPKGVKTAILFPHHWLDMVKEDPILQLGALVYIGSQAVDAYNDKLVGQTDVMMKRAAAFEAEYLTIVQKLIPDHTLTEYQRGVLEAFPLGLASPDALALTYKSKPFVIPS